MRLSGVAACASKNGQRVTFYTLSARIAMNKRTRPELRGRMYAELAQYVFPKRNAMEHTGALTYEVAMKADFSKLTIDERRQLLALTKKLTAEAPGEEKDIPVRVGV